MSRFPVSALRQLFALIVAVLFSCSLLAQAPSGDVVISSDTTWPTATYALSSLSVQGGATLTVGGGSTVTVSGGVTVTGNSSIVLQSLNNTGKVNGAYVGVGVTLQAGSVQVDSGSSINADGQGYLSSARRAETDGASGASGGSYGGLGGYQAAPTYGSASAPVDLGSGGAAAQYYGGAGGGAVRLIVSGRLTNNGTVSANGEAVNTTCNCGGGGAGGSVWVTAGTLAGSGQFTANGGPNLSTLAGSGAGAGGGGRIAVYYAGPSSFTGFAASTASGGTYTSTLSGYAGSNGTAAFFDTSATNSNVTVYASGFQLPANTTAQYNSFTAANNAVVTIGSGSVITLSSLSVQNGTLMTVGGGSTVTVANGVTVSGNSSIVLQSLNNSGKVNDAWAGTGVTLQASSVQVDIGSSINADGQGYLSSARRAETDGASGGSGGSYGGLGGYQPGLMYGSASAPVDLGSGGAGAQYYGSAGGGAVRLIVSGTLTNNGTISASGQDTLFCQYGGCGGAGAGGSVYVTTAGLAGAGNFTANGGSNTPASKNGSAAGGGGRVAVYYAGPSTFTGFTASTASGGTYTGTQTGYAGSNGTAVFFDTSVPNSNVTVYESGFQLPANSTVQYNSLTATNGALVTVGNNSTISLSALSAQGSATVTVGGGSTVTVTNGVTVTGNSNIVLQSLNNTGKVNGAYVGVGVTLQASSVQVDSGSSINADGQGYLSSARRAETDGASGGSGGSYGGLGGYQAAPTYGSASAPIDLGSGGAGAQYYGSAGGGAVRLIVSGRLTNNGTISANGQDTLFCQYGGCGGAGAGGSVYVTTAGLAGTGSFTANGGSNTPVSKNGSAAGGGGRVAVYYAGPSTFTGFTASTASGGIYTGTENGYAGSNGTAVFFDTSVPNSNATVYQHFEVPANASVQYNSLTVANTASITLGGGSQLTVAQALQVTGTLTAQSTNNTAQINGKWVGKGVVIAAGSLQIDATGSINADAQGYPQNDGPGAGSYTSGGSYGGLGGAQAGTTAYGSLQSPIDLGSGGGGGQNTGGGAGGGAIELLVSGTLTNNGVVSANGGSISQSGYGGGGSGGSIFVQTHTLQGSGTIAANGGSNLTPNNAGSGGGGGRISVAYLINSGVPASALTVNPGTGANTGTVGSINFVQAAGLQWLLPSKSVVHGNAALQWSSNTGSVTTVSVAGPQTGTLASSGVGISNATWNTSTYPDGAYELRLTASDSTGVVGTVSENVVVNNSVQWVSGRLTADTHWTADKVYALEGDLIVPPGITLTIDAGSVVKALDNVQIVVQSGGTLTALGTQGSPVVFTTFDDSSVGGNTSFGSGVPQPGDWAGINVAGGGTFNNNTNTYVLYGHGTLGSTLAADTTLLSSQAYEIAGLVTVPSGVTLTVQPGAVVKFDPGAGILVNPGGHLVANGTLAQPIYFTSINDQTVGANLIAIANPNAPLTAPSPGDWNHIEVQGTAAFNFAHILYGGGPVPTVTQGGMLQSSNGGTVTLSNSTLAYSYYIGIQTGLSGTGDTYTITNTTFFNNQERAINVYGGSTVHVVNCTFDGNAAGPFNHGGAIDISNSVITGFTNTQFGGVGGPMSTFTNNDVYTTAPGVPKYSGFADPTGMNGNISADPVYVNAAQHDYRPNYGSPLIDAANGTVANYPATDAFNDTRYNAPLVRTKTGTADSSGKYPDIGALEFVQSAPSNLDLAVSAVQGPASALVGTQVQVKWTVTNVGTGTAYGPWHDAVYLVRNPKTVPVEMYAGQVLSGQNIVLGPGATYAGTATITVPGAVVGEHSWEVKTNVLGEVFEGANTANNSAISLNPVQVDVPALSAGSAVSGSFSTQGQAVYYKVTPSAAQATRVQLVLQQPAAGSVQVFVGGGYVPSPQRYDYQQSEFNSATATVVIPAGTAQTYYIAAYPQVLTASPTTFTVTANTVSFSLNSVSPASAATGGTATLTFSGGNFTANTAFRLVSASGVMYSPATTSLFDSDDAVATFDLTKVPAGTYTVQAIDGPTLSLANAFTVLPAAGSGTVLTNTPNVEVSLETPSAFRAGFSSFVTLHYRSIATSDIPAPILYISANNATLAAVPPQCDGCDATLPSKLANTFNSGLLLGINREGPAGILPPGAEGSVQFIATPLSNSDVTFSATAAVLDPVAFGYEYLHCLAGSAIQILCNASEQTGAYVAASEFCSSLSPVDEVVNPGFLRACMQMLNNAGYTYTPFIYISGEFPSPSSAPSDGFVGPHVPIAGWNKLLANAATALSANGDYEYDTQKLVAYELQKDGMVELSARYHQGAFGYGPSHPFDITLSIAAGYPVITYPDGVARAFVTPSGSQANTFLGPVGDYAVIRRDMSTSSGDWLLTEADGSSSHFIGRGDSNALGAYDRLDFIQDTDGNKLQMSYTGSSLTGVTDRFGSTMSYRYDSLGHIVSATDAVGRVTSYTYDNVPLTYYDGAVATYGSFLTSATDNVGTTRFDWNEGGTAHPVGYFADACIATFCDAPIGIHTVTYPDGTHTYYTYDAVGRNTGSSGDGGANTLAYTYNPDGSVVFTDAFGKSTVMSHNANGNILSSLDELGNLTRFRYNAEGYPSGSVSALGSSAAITYDGQGNAASVVSAVGNATSLGYGSARNLLSLTDPNGDALSFTFDSSDNPTSQVYPNGTSETTTYDSFGRVLTQTNRRGSTMTFAYGPTGLLTSKTYADGSQVLFTYDSHNNLQSISAPSGTTQYTFDAADRLTAITSPSGSLRYTYNASGQRIRMTDSTGFTVGYTYDAAGRHASVTNASGVPIASYIYDAVGQLLTKTLANGTSAAYTYDARGMLQRVVNKTTAGGVLSEYDYTYDAEGKPVSMASPSGTSLFGYDLDGQLVSAAGPSATVQYTYDAAGNRTQTVGNGITRQYQTNNLNQYTAAGSSAYQYDADGNLVSGDGWTYTYDQENRLTAMVNGSDSWSFQYDGLNRRISSVHNGTVTRYLVDPLSYENVVAELDATGTATAHYIYGIDLTASVQASGAAGFYHFDGTGNTTQITNATGTVVNSYAYQPYGEKTVLASSVANPFTYNGRFGVRDEGTGLYDMRSRWYSPSLGRFQQLDPAGLADGPNRYRYALNSPVANNDPFGLLGAPVGRSGPAPPAPDYASISLSGAGVTVTVTINAHDGGLTIAPGLATGTGGNYAVGRYVNLPAGVNRGDAVQDALQGLGFNASGYAVAGGGVNLSAGGQVSIDAGGGFGGRGGSVSYGIQPDSYVKGYVQDAWRGGNYLTGGRLFGTPMTNPFGPRVLNHSLAGQARVLQRRTRPNGSRLTKPGTKRPVKVNGSIDPNAKIASGFSDQGFIPVGVPITYTIYFENLPTATLPAQKVVVTDQLAATLDWSTVQLQQVNFNSASLQVPANTKTYHAQTTVSSDPNPVSVDGTLNPGTGVLTWTMQSINPNTGGTPADPLAGFLPPNTGSNAGVGSVVFTVMPKTGLANSAAITNQASIVFDANATINTNTVTNTIDSSPVGSFIGPLPSTTVATPDHSFPVTWSGTDTGGSGIAGYDIYVSIDGGQYTQWLASTPSNSAIYAAAYPGHTYSFVSYATNNVGNVQTVLAPPQTTKVVLQTPIITVVPASTTVTGTQPLTVVITAAGVSVPTGSVTLTNGSYLSSSVALAGGTATVIVPAGALSPGANTLTAFYTPDTIAGFLYQASSGSAVVTLSPATVPMPNLSLSPAALVFTTNSGKVSPAQTVTLGNTGTDVLTITSIALSGQGASAFTQTGNCAATLAPGANCAVTVAFAPTSIASFTASLNVSSNTTGTSSTVGLSGTATAPATFTLNVTPSTQTVAAGSAATFTVSITPQGGSYDSPISLSAMGLPTGATAVFAPSTVTTGSAVATSTLTIRIPQVSASNNTEHTRLPAVLAVLSCLLIATRNRRRLVEGIAAFFVLFYLSAGLSGCGTPRTVSTTSSITVTATSGSQTQTATITLKVP